MLKRTLKMLEKKVQTTEEVHELIKEKDVLTVWWAGTQADGSRLCQIRCEDGNEYEIEVID